MATTYEAMSSPSQGGTGELWPSNTYVEFDGSLNAALKKLRHALGDSADNPTYVETVARRGYRFIAPVETVCPQLREVELSAVKPVESSQESGAPQLSGRLRGSLPGKGINLPLAPVAELRSPDPVTMSFPAHKQAASRSRAVVLAVVIATLAFPGAALYWLLPVPSPRVLRSVQLTHFGRAASDLSLMTDGARIFFSEVRGRRYTLDQVPVAGGEPAPFPTPFPNAEALDISPDHTELLVASFTGFQPNMVLWAAPVTGGTPRRLGDAAGSSAAWSPDGQTIAYTRDAELYIVRRDGSAQQRLTTVSGAAELDRIRWSPSGRTLRFTVTKSSAPVTSQWEVSADGSSLHPLPAEPKAEADDGEGFGNWTPDGRYFVDRSFEGGIWRLWARREFGGILRKFNRKPSEIFDLRHPPQGFRGCASLTPRFTAVS